MIHIISTGGTIEGLDYEDPDNHGLSKAISIDRLLDQIGYQGNFVVEKILDKDSRFISEPDRIKITDKIKSISGSKILLTHGTITMVETAKYLGKLKLDKTIVLTGAFILGTDPNTDAGSNLNYALQQIENLQHGVFIAMHQQIFLWDNVVKNSVANQFEPLT